MSFYSICSEKQKLTIIQDLIHIVEKNHSNAVILNNYYEFKLWLFDLVLENQFTL